MTWFLITLSFPTVLPVVYEYQIFIEVNTTDADQLRNTLKNILFPVQISSHTNISEAGITTGENTEGRTGFSVSLKL